jgi:hypothetical protein
VSHVQSAVNDVEKALKTSNGDVSTLPALMAVVEERLGKAGFTLTASAELLVDEMWLDCTVIV